MLTYFLKRLLYALPIALSVTVVSFMLVYLAPGDPLNAIAPADAPADVIQALKSAYGLDRPVPVQYGLWLWRAVQGDLGTSIASGRAVATEVLGAVSNTLVLAGVAAGLGVVVGCVLGALAGYKHGGWVDRVATLLSVVGGAFPTTGWDWCSRLCFPSGLAGSPPWARGPVDPQSGYGTLPTCATWCCQPSLCQ